MPSKSKAQRNLMAAAAHNPAFAKKVGVPVSVAKEFNQADKGKKFGKGGEMKESKAMAKKEIAFMQKKGAPKSMIKHEKAEYGMKKGGSTCEAAAKKEVKGHEKRMHGMAKGGLAAGHKSANGIAKKGLTKGKEVKMCGGGMMKKTGRGR